MAKKINVRVGTVNVWPVPHIRLVGLHSILLLCEQAQMSEYGVLAEYLQKKYWNKESIW